MVSYFKFFLFFVSFFCSLKVWAIPEDIDKDGRFRQFHCEMMLREARFWGFLTPKEEPSESKRIDAALEMAVRVPEILVEIIDKLEIKDQASLIAIGKKMAAHPRAMIPIYMRKAGIESEKARIEIAKIAAAHDTYGNLAHFFSDCKIQDQKTILEIVEIAFNAHPSRVASNFSKFKIRNESIRIHYAKAWSKINNGLIADSIDQFDIHDQATLVELATQAAHAGSTNLVDYFKKFNIHSPIERFKIAKIVAHHHPNLVAEGFENFEIENEEDRLEIAKAIFDSSHYGLSRHVRMFHLTSEKYRIELAKISAVKFPKEFIENVGYYDIQSQPVLLELAKTLAVQFPSHVSHNIQNFRLKSESDRFEVAKVAARPLERSGFTVHYENYEITNPQYIMEVARIAASSDAYFGTHFSKFKIDDVEDRIELAKIYAAYLPRNAIQNLRNFNLNTKGYEEVIHLAAQVDGITAFYSFSTLQQSGTPFTDPSFMKVFLDAAIRSSRNKNHSIEERLKHYESIQHSSGYSSLVPYLSVDEGLIALFAGHFQVEFIHENPLAHLSRLLQHYELEKFIPLLTDRSRHADVQTRLFQQIWRIQFGNNPQEKQRLSDRMDSLNLVEIALGLPNHSLDAWIQFSNDRRNTFYELALEIAELQPGLFSEFPHIRDVLVKKQNESLLALIRDNLALGSPPELLEVLKITDEKKMGEELKALFAERMKSVFADLKLSVPYDEFLQIRQRWGDLEPVFTLMARFKGSGHWQSELPWLGHIFSAEIRHQFQELKFTQGIDEADTKRLVAQLNFLSEEQKSEWLKMRHLVEAYESAHDRINAGQKIIARRQALIPLANQLMLHLGEVWLTAGPSHEADDLKKYFTKKQDPRKNLQELRQKYSDSVILASLMKFFDKLSYETDDEEIKTHLIFIKINAGELIKSQVDQDQILSDVQDLLSRLRETEDKKDNEKFIVYTTLIQDAKGLLTIGDLVEASSCQNYKTGSHIETLLGYVLDANVQGVASFALSKSHFKSEKEFLAAHEAVQQNADAIRMDPYSHVFTIQTRIGEVQSIPVKKAHHRQILKLGQTDERKPGLRLERAYQQNHKALSFMGQQAHILKARIEDSIGVGRGAITIPKSRNPGGVYSDLSGGKKSDTYTIQ